MPMSSGNNTLNSVHYLFVDGNALHSKLKAVSKAYFDEQQFEIDFRKLAANSDKTFYYEETRGNRGNSGTLYLLETRGHYTYYGDANG